MWRDRDVDGMHFMGIEKGTMFINAIGAGYIINAEIFLANDSTLHSKTIDWIVATRMLAHRHKRNTECETKCTLS